MENGREGRHENILVPPQADRCTKRWRSLYAENLARRKVLLVKTLVQPDLMGRNGVRGAVGDDVSLFTIMRERSAIFKDCPCFRVTIEIKEALHRKEYSVHRQQHRVEQRTIYSSGLHLPECEINDKISYTPAASRALTGIIPIRGARPIKRKVGITLP